MAAAVDYNSLFYGRDDLDRHKTLSSEIYLLERELGMRSFRDFHKMSWHVIEPAVTLTENWHLDAITDHGQALARGEIKNLIINVPPRHTKSSVISIQLPAWIWTWKPSDQILGCSYNQAIAERDSRKSRLLIQSPWYQLRWGDVFTLSGDQNAKRRYENDKNGNRQAMSVEKGTGEGGDIILVDDPHNVQEANSTAKRKAALIWRTETMPTRLNDHATGRRCIIMQRVHESDISGYNLSREMGWDHLNLPAEYEGKCIVEIPHKCSQTVIKTNAQTKEETVLYDEGTSIGYKDPRTKQDELLNSVRFPRPIVDALKLELGEYATACQLQQRPQPREGGMFKMARVKLVRELPPGLIKITRGWDKAATVGGGCSSAGVKIGRYTDGRFIFLHVSEGEWSSGDREAEMLAQAELDGTDVSIVHEQEPGSGGKDSAIATSRNLAGFNVVARTATGDKVSRADPLSRAIERGDYDMLEGDWNQKFVDEMRSWPASKKLDQGDAAATAHNDLALGGMDWIELYPADSAKDKDDGLGMFYGDDDIDEGGDTWALG